MCIVLFVAAAVSMLAQAATQPLAGTWTADHQGKPVVRLELQTMDGAVGGWIQLADIHLDTQGNVDEVMGGLSARAPLIDVAVRGRTLVFARHDGDDIDHFQLTLTDDGRAELLFVPSEEDRKELADSGIPLPKPIRITRQK